MMRYCLFAFALPIALSALGHGHDHNHKDGGLQFHENKGQWPGHVFYRAAVPGGAVFVERAAFTYFLRTGGEWEAHGRPDHVIGPLRMHAVKVHFEGGGSEQHKGDHKLPHYVNYFIGNDPAKWGTNAGVFAQVSLNEVYPGIDLRVDGHDGLKYDWLVGAGADPSQVVMRYEGQEAIELKEGVLFIGTSAGDLIEQRPVAWQEINGVRVPVRCEFKLEGDRLSFQFPDGHDQRWPLTIDPQVIFSSYSGSTGDNFGFTATYDAAGHLYGGGLVLASGYPVTAGVVGPNYSGFIGCDMGISKFSPDGSTLLWSTYIGGTGSEVPHSMVVNSNEELFVMGTTNSTDYPVNGDAFQGSFNGGTIPPFSGSYGFTYDTGSDIVVSHLNATATAFIGSTYVGGSGNDGLNQFSPLLRNYGDPFRGEIILDLNEDPIVVSSTNSPDMITTPGAPQPSLAGGLDAFVFRMDPALTMMQWATYHGGSANDAGFGVQVSSTGEIYITGGTLSTDLPTSAGAFSTTNSGDVDGYITRYDPIGTQLLSSTFLGTPQFDQSYFVQLNVADEVFVVGQSTGNYPVTPGKYVNATGLQFIHKFSGDLSTSEWSTRIGGTSSQNISPTAFLVSFCGQIYFSGWAGPTNLVPSSPNGLPVTTDAYQSVSTGSDFYLMMLEPEATSLGYATFFGGSAAEHVDGGTSRFDKNGIVYQAVCAGCQNLSYPTTPGVWSNTNNSTNCNLGVFKIDFEQAVQVGIQVNALNLTGCLGDPMVFTAIGNADTWIWDLGDGSPVTTGTQLIHTYETEGVYEVMLIGVDSTSCNFADTALTTVTVAGPADLQPSFDFSVYESCQGYDVTLTSTGTGTTEFYWDLGDGTTSDESPYTHFYQLPDEYIVTLYYIDPICPDTMPFTIPITLDPPVLDLDLPSPVALCNGAAVQLDAGSGFTTYLWSTGQVTQTISVQQPGTYSVAINDGICTGGDTVQVFAQPVHPMLQDLLVCPGVEVALSPPVPVQSVLWSTGDTSSTISPLIGGEYWFTAIDEYGCAFQDTVFVEITTGGEGAAYIPNVFSPNGDSKNDTFEVVGLSLDQFSMEVFNRWGQLMYNTNNPALGWNGGLDNSGSDVPDGTYFYVITFKDNCSTEPLTTHHGHVTLVR